MTEVLDRRLPVYLLLDCSESMLGEGIEAVETGVASLIRELQGDPHALETVWASVITFADTAHQTLPLTEIGKLAAPRLKTRPGTALGSALQMLHDRIRQEVKPHSGDQKGDWRPLAFLLSDGSPTDDWQDAAKRVRTLAVKIVAIGCGPDVDREVLRQITDTVLLLQNASPGDFKALFQWISSSVTIGSRRIGGDDFSLMDLPKGVLTKANGAPAGAGNPSSLKRELFLSVRCSTFKKPYLIRYRLTESGEAYEPVRTHVVEDDYFGGKAARDTISSVPSDKLRGVPPCPRCENSGCGLCQCGALFCMADAEERPTCPACGSVLKMGEGHFDVSGRHG